MRLGRLQHRAGGVRVETYHACGCRHPSADLLPFTGLVDVLKRDLRAGEDEILRLRQLCAIGVREREFAFLKRAVLAFDLADHVAVIGQAPTLALGDLHDGHALLAVWL